MADYFGGLRTPEEIKTAYRKLCMRRHPDRGGDTETMKQINAAYQEALKAVDGVTSQGKRVSGFTGTVKEVHGTGTRRRNDALGTTVAALWTISPPVTATKGSNLTSVNK